MAKIELARVHNTRTFFSLFEDGRAGRIQRTSCGLDCFHALRAHVQMYGSVTVYGYERNHYKRPLGRPFYKSGPFSVFTHHKFKRSKISIKTYVSLESNKSKDKCRSYSYNSYQCKPAPPITTCNRTRGSMRLVARRCHAKVLGLGWKKAYALALLVLWGCTAAGRARSELQLEELSFPIASVARQHNHGRAQRTLIILEARSHPKLNTREKAAPWLSGDDVLRSDRDASPCQWRWRASASQRGCPHPSP